MLDESGAAGGSDSQALSRLNRYLGDRIGRNRIAQGMLPIDLAQALGIEEKSIVEYELGLVKADAVTLHGIAEALDVRLSALYGFA